MSLASRPGLVHKKFHMNAIRVVLERKKAFDFTFHYH